MKQMEESVDIFNAVKLGYAVIESRRLDDWRRFLKQGIGMHLAREKQYPEAIEKLTIGVKAYPENWQAWKLMGSATKN